MKLWVSVILLLCAAAQNSEAVWNKIAQMPVPLSCGFFFDDSTGLIGSGRFYNAQLVSNDSLYIWRTSNGGTTWIPCTVPRGTGRLTSIFMRDRMVGYASLYTDTYSLWKTTDGGSTWYDITGSQFSRNVAVHATSRALIKTSWAGFASGGRNWNAGGFSVNDGLSFNDNIFDSHGLSTTNGIAFSDDLNGVVVPGSGNGDYTLFTNDGGLTWNRGDLHPESWGIYALQNTTTFFTLGEGVARNPQRIVRMSTNTGATWTDRYNFPTGNIFTGAIGGKCSTLYVQTTRPVGFYRSDDLGISWKPIGGPANTRDTRFIVQGGNGEIIYAFDSVGGVHKTVDGGDGTLPLPGSGVNFSFTPDTVQVYSVDCLTSRAYATLITGLCSGLTIDTIYVESGAGFSVDTISLNGTNFDGMLRIPIRFYADSGVTEQGRVRFRAHAGAFTIDTLLPVRGVSTVDVRLMWAPDTAEIWTAYCQPEWTDIKFWTPPCSDFHIDTMYIETGAGEFEVAKSLVGQTVGMDTSVASVSFQYHEEAVRSGGLRIRATHGSTKVDTLIPLRAKHVTAPVPRVGDIESVAAGEETIVPVYLTPTQDTFTIKRYSLHLSFNTDLLECKDFDVIGTLSTPIENAEIIPDSFGATFNCEMQNALIGSSDLSNTPLIKLKMKATLTSEWDSPVRLDTFSIGRTAPLPLCTTPEQLFTILYECGDSILVGYLRDPTNVSIFSIIPNPASGGETITLSYYVPTDDSRVIIDILNADGKLISSQETLSRTGKGVNRHTISSASLAAGVYSVRLHTQTGYTTSRFVVVK